jgi:DNA modification methylase
MAENILYYGDNLEILRRYIEDESVDLVHLDPPFKSNQDYNILFAGRGLHSLRRSPKGGACEFFVLL